MGFNIEIKARVDSVADLEPLVIELGAQRQGVLAQTDVYFKSQRGRLKLRRTNQRTPELIHYQRGDRTGPKGSRYQRWPLKDAEETQEALGAALGVKGVVQKDRTLYMLDRTRIHLDRVKGLGEFLELEVVLQHEGQSAQGRRTAHDILNKLGIAKADLLKGSYIDLISASNGED